MLTVRVAVRVQPEGRDAFVARLTREHEEVPAQFAGCRRFDAYASPNDPDSFLIYEEWTDRDAFDSYTSSAYFTEGGAVLFPLLDGAPDSAYYESELVGP